MEKFHKNFFITLFAQNNPVQKNFDAIFSLKRSLHKPRKICETVNPIFGLAHKI